MSYSEKVVKYIIPLMKATALLDPASRRRKRKRKAVENPVDIQ